MTLRERRNADAMVAFAMTGSASFAASWGWMVVGVLAVLTALVVIRAKTTAWDRR